MNFDLNSENKDRVLKAKFEIEDFAFILQFGSWFVYHAMNYGVRKNNGYGQRLQVTPNGVQKEKIQACLKGFYRRAGAKDIPDFYEVEFMKSEQGGLILVGRQKTEKGDEESYLNFSNSAPLLAAIFDHEIATSPPEIKAFYEDDEFRELPHVEMIMVL